jgi:4,5-DOPA dioxygenase extradiol
MNAIENNNFTEKWETIGKTIPKPKEILSISAHWYTKGTRTSNSYNPRIIYDFYGFPESLYQVSYPVKGSPSLSKKLTEIINDNIIIDNDWGIDHGTWSVLRRMFPDADIPVVQLSIDSNATFEKHFEYGQKLSKLRDSGVLIFCSGNVVHNLALLNWNKSGGFPWAEEFDDYIKTNIENHELEKIINYENAGSCSKKAFYTPEHFIPLLYAAGSSDKNDTVEVFNDDCLMGSLSMTGYIFK